jgi:hypothetical protein
MRAKAEIVMAGNTNASRPRVRTPPANAAENARRYTREPFFPLSQALQKAQSATDWNAMPGMSVVRNRP